jgi:predicted RecB family endonuclease
MTDTMNPLGSVVARITNLIELITTLDKRLIEALDSMRAMEEHMDRLGTVGNSGDELVADLRRRVATTDDRVNRDLDELKATVEAKLAEVDLAAYDGRFEKLERSIQNIERATVNLDRMVEGAMSILPDRLEKKVRQEGAKSSTTEPPQPRPPA